MITTDQNLRFQQHLPSLPLAVMVLCARSNRLADLVALVPQVTEALLTLQPCTLVEVRA